MQKKRRKICVFKNKAVPLRAFSAVENLGLG